MPWTCLLPDDDDDEEEWEEDEEEEVAAAAAAAGAGGGDADLTGPGTAGPCWGVYAGSWPTCAELRYPVKQRDMLIPGKQEG